MLTPTNRSSSDMRLSTFGARLGTRLFAASREHHGQYREQQGNLDRKLFINRSSI